MKGTTFYQIPGTEICPGWIVEADRCGSELFVEVWQGREGHSQMIINFNSDIVFLAIKEY